MRITLSPGDLRVTSFSLGADELTAQAAGPDTHWYTCDPLGWTCGCTLPNC